MLLSNIPKNKTKSEALKAIKFSSHFLCAALLGEGHDFQDAEDPLGGLSKDRENTRLRALGSYKLGSGTMPFYSSE